MWDATLTKLVKKDIQAAYNKEVQLIDWIFEKGVPDHLTKEEVVNFLNYNFKVIVTDLEIPLEFKVDERLYEERSSWMFNNIRPAEPDFFDSPVGGYSSLEEELTEDDIDNIFN